MPPPATTLAAAWEKQLLSLPGITAAAATPGLGCQPGERHAAAAASQLPLGECFFPSRPPPPSPPPPTATARCHHHHRWPMPLQGLMSLLSLAACLGACSLPPPEAFSQFSATPEAAFCWG